MIVQGAAGLTATISDAVQGTSIKKLRAEQTAANAAYKQAEANMLFAQAEIEKAKASAATGVAFLQTQAAIESEKSKRSQETNLTGFALAGLALLAVVLLMRRKD
jgi:peptidoglycan hydrolase-like amidase